MWPRRTTVQQRPGKPTAMDLAMTEKRPLLPPDPADPAARAARAARAAPATPDEPLLAGCGKRIGVKPEGMGYVVVDAPKGTTAASRTGSATSTLQQWGAVAATLVAGLTGKQKTQRTPAPDG